MYDIESNPASDTNKSANYKGGPWGHKQRDYKVLLLVKGPRRNPLFPQSISKEELTFKGFSAQHKRENCWYTWAWPDILAFKSRHFSAFSIYSALA